MTQSKNYILAPGTNESSYQENLGFEEMVNFYKEATQKKIEELERAIKNEDFEEFKRIIYQVTGTKLQ